MTPDDRAFPRTESDRPEVEKREVRVQDPHLSSQTNERLTEEVREVVGAEAVEVPVDRERAAEGEYAMSENWLGYLTLHRLTFIRIALIVLTFGAIVALVTNVWWVLPLAAGVHALGTMVVALATVHLTTIDEHPSPQLAAALTEEGISGTDEHFSRLVDEFRPARKGAVGDVLSPGGDERSVPAGEEPALAGAEQSRAMTPTAQPSRSSPAGGTPDAIIWTTIAGLLVVSFVIPPLSGSGWMWLLPVVTIPLLGAFTWVQVTMARRPERLQVHSLAQILGLTAAVVLAVAAFCVAVAVGVQSSS